MAASTPKLRQDQRGVWRARWTDAFGKRHSVSFGADERAAAESFRRWLARWSVDLTVRNPVQVAAVPKIREAWQRYEAFADRYYRRADGTATQEPKIVAHAMAEVLNLYGHVAADALTPGMLRTVQERWIARGLRVTTITGWTHKIRRVWRWMAAEGVIPAGVADSLRQLAPVKAGRCGAAPSRAVLPVSDSAVDLTVAQLPPSIAAMIRLQQLTGMRPGEVCALRPCEVDTRGEVWIYRPAAHKMAYQGRGREIMLGPQAQTVLRPYLGREVAFPCFRPYDAMRERAAARVAAYIPSVYMHDYRRWQSYQRRADERAERQRPHAGWSAAAYGKAIGSAARKAGVEPWSPNQIRHAVATKIRDRFGLEAAQVMLGHSRADVTQIYAEKSKRLAEDLAGRLG